MTIIHNKPEMTSFPKNNFWLLYGSPKTGKSSFAATWDKVLCFDLEAGYKYIESDIIVPESYANFLKEIKDPKTLKPYNTIVIDTIDIIYEFIEKNSIKELNRKSKTSYDSIAEFAHGTGWAIARLSLKKFIFNEIFRLTRMDKNVVVIAHEKAITIQRNNKEETAYKLALPGQTSTMVSSLADIVGRVYTRKIAGKFEPRLSFVPGLDDGGSRLKVLAGKDMSLNFETLKTVIESNKPKSKPKKLTDIAKNKTEKEDKNW